MSRLIYSATASLDGFINDEHGNYDWAVPGEDLVKHFNDEAAAISTYLYGRKMYEEMKGWETDPSAAAQSPESARFAQIWQDAQKVVFSSTLNTVETRNTRLERRLDANLVDDIKRGAAGDLTVDGPTLAAAALHAGVVDEIHRFVMPIIVGGGTPIFPPRLRLRLEPIEERPFERGIRLLRYKVLNAT